MISRIIKVEVRVISRSRRLRLITLTETLIILDITKTESNNCFIIHWTKKNLSHVFASSLTASNTKRANLTWLPLEIMHRGHTWHDYPWPWHDYSWPWHDYCIICSLWRHGRWFRKFAVLFRPIRKELESSMYNNTNKPVIKLLSQQRLYTKTHFKLRANMASSLYTQTHTLRTPQLSKPIALHLFGMRYGTCISFKPTIELVSRHAMGTYRTCDCALFFSTGGWMEKNIQGWTIQGYKTPNSSTPNF